MKRHWNQQNNLNIDEIEKQWKTYVDNNRIKTIKKNIENIYPDNYLKIKKLYPYYTPSGYFS